MHSLLVIANKYNKSLEITDGSFWNTYWLKKAYSCLFIECKVKLIIIRDYRERNVHEMV